MKLSKELTEAVKELIRTFILGEIPVLIAILGVIKSGIDTEVGGFFVKWILVLAILTAGTLGVLQTALMSALDKWLHEKDVKTPLDLKSLDILKK